MEHPEHGQAGADGVPGLHRNQAGDAAAGVGLHDLVRGLDQLQLSAVRLRQPLDQVDLLQGQLHRVLVLGTARGVGNPQLRVYGKLCKYGGGGIKNTDKWITG